MPQWAIVYGKFVHDKDLGIYLDGVYFGGIATSEDEVKSLSRDVVDHTRGGVIIPKSFLIERQHSFPTLLTLSIQKFNQLETEMVQNEVQIEENTARARRRR